MFNDENEEANLYPIGYQYLSCPAYFCESKSTLKLINRTVGWRACCVKAEKHSISTKIYSTAVFLDQDGGPW